jgi:hypothetical protein
MKKILLFGLGLTLIGALIGQPARADSWYPVYQEDFETDPAFDSPWRPNKVHWDSNAGNYFAQAHDHNGAHRYYLAMSPVFDEKITPSDDFRINFDVHTTEPDWGHYPGLRFVDSDSNDPEDQNWPGRSFNYKVQSWSDHTHKKMQLRMNGTKHVSGSSVKQGRWYEVALEYDGQSQTIDWTVTRQDNQATFLTKKSLSFPLANGFDQFTIGERTGGTAYGDRTRMRLDNMSVETFGDAVAVPNPTAALAGVSLLAGFWLRRWLTRAG